MQLHDRAGEILDDIQAGRSLGAYDGIDPDAPVPYWTGLVAYVEEKDWYGIVLYTDTGKRLTWFTVDGDLMEHDDDMMVLADLPKPVTTTVKTVFWNLDSTMQTVLGTRDKVVKDLEKEGWLKTNINAVATVLVHPKHDQTHKAVR